MIPRRDEVKPSRRQCGWKTLHHDVNNSTEKVDIIRPFALIVDREKSQEEFPVGKDTKNYYNVIEVKREEINGRLKIPAKNRVSCTWFVLIPKLPPNGLLYTEGGVRYLQQRTLLRIGANSSGLRGPRILQFQVFVLSLRTSRSEVLILTPALQILFTISKSERRHRRSYCLRWCLSQTSLCEPDNLAVPDQG